MIDFLFLIWGLVPVGMGLGFLYRPRKMIQAQTRFRKRMEKFEKKLYKSHRVTGLAFLLIGVVFLMTVFYPQWMVNAVWSVKAILQILRGQYPVTPATIKPAFWA